MVKKLRFIVVIFLAIFCTSFLITSSAYAVQINITWNEALGDNAKWAVSGQMTTATTDTTYQIDLDPGDYTIVSEGGGIKLYFTVKSDGSLESIHNFVTINGSNMTIFPQTFTVFWNPKIGDDATWDWYISYITNYGITEASYEINLLPGNFSISYVPGNKINFTINADWSITGIPKFVTPGDHTLTINPEQITLIWDPKLGDADTWSWDISYVTDYFHTEATYPVYLLPGTYNVSCSVGSNFSFTVESDWMTSSINDFIVPGDYTLTIQPKLFTVTWDPPMGDYPRWVWAINYVTDATGEDSHTTNLLPGNYEISYGSGNDFLFTLNQDWSVTCAHGFVQDNNMEIIIHPEPFIINWEPEIDGSWYGSWSIVYVTNYISESNYFTHFLPGEYKLAASWETSCNFTIDDSFNVSPQQNSVYNHTIDILPADSYVTDSLITFNVTTNKLNNIFPDNEEPFISVTVVNNDTQVRSLTIYYTFSDLRGNIIKEDQSNISVPAQGQIIDTMSCGLTSGGLAEGVVQIVNTNKKILFGRLANETQEVPSFSSLAESDSPTIEIGHPKISAETNNPFGVFTHRELPNLETVRLMADAGFGTSCEGQFKSTGDTYQGQSEVESLTLQIALGIDPIVEVPMDLVTPENNLAQYLKGQNLFYRIGRGEANNRGMSAQEFIDEITPIVQVYRNEDSTARIQIDELGDVGPVTYMKELDDLGIASLIDAAAWGCHADYGGGSGMANALRMMDLAEPYSIESFVYPMFHNKGGELFHAKSTLRYAIHYYMLGIDRLIWYKMNDIYDDYGILYIDGTIGPTYMAFQNLCSLISDSTLPAEFSFDIESSVDMDKLAVYTLQNGPDEIDIILWNNTDLWESDLYDTYRKGGNWYFYPYTKRDKNLPPTQTNIFIGSSEYKYPVMINLLTGSCEELDYEVIGDDILLKNLKVSDYPKMIKLVKGGTRPREWSNQTFQEYSMADGLASNWVTSIYPDGDDIWFGVYSYGGENADIISKMSKGTGNCTNLQTWDNKAGFMVRSIVADSTNVYAGIWGRGVGIYNKTNGAWVIKTMEDGLASPNIMDIALDDGYLWVATWGGGLSRYDISTGNWTMYKHSEENQLTGGAASAYSIVNWISSVAVSDNYVWVGSYCHGISRYDNSGGTWTNYKGQFTIDRIWEIAVDGDDVWFGTEEGIIKFNDPTDTFSTPASLADKKVTLITVDGDDIWFGTYYEGLSKYNKISHTWTDYEPSTTDGLTNGRIASIIASEDYIWVPSWGGGVSKLEKASGTWQNITTTDGLIDNRVWTVAADGKDIWFGTYRGATKISLVQNQPPVADAGGPYEGDEGPAMTFNASTSSDPDGDQLQYRWDFNNDGGWDTDWSDNPMADHTWGDDWSGTAKLEVSDGLESDSDIVSVTVNNVVPSVEAGDDITVDEGTEVVFNGGFTDSGADTHTYEWDFGDGTTASDTLTPAHVYSDNAEYIVKLTITDDDEGVGTDTLTVTVNNVAPSVKAGSDQITDEGTLIFISSTFTDQGWLDTHTATIDWGDDLVEAGLVDEENCAPDASGTVSGSYTYGDNGMYTVIVTVIDDEGEVGSDTLMVTVRNVSPAVLDPAVEGPMHSNQGIFPNLAIWGGDTLNFFGSFTDPGWLDIHTADWDFGDGTTQTGTLTEENIPPDSTGTVTGSHIFYEKGTYTVALIVNDDDEGIGANTLEVAVKPIPAVIDIDADTLNLNSNGKWLTCYIELPEGCGVERIAGKDEKVKVEIEGDISPSQQEFLDFIIQQIDETIASVEIELEAEEGEVEYEVKGYLSQEAQAAFQGFIEDLTFAGNEVEFKIKKKINWKNYSTLIDISTVMLSHMGSDWVQAVNDAKYGFVRHPKLKDRDKNGLSELMVKFDRPTVQGILLVGEDIELMVTGKAYCNQGWADFEGTDTIRVKKKGKKGWMIGEEDDDDDNKGKQSKTKGKK